MTQYFLDAVLPFQDIDDLPCDLELNVCKCLPGSSLNLRSSPVSRLLHAVIRDDDIPAQPSFLPMLIDPLSHPAGIVELDADAGIVEVLLHFPPAMAGMVGDAI